MRKLANKQNGITFIGLVLILAIIAFFTLFALRLFPLYSEKLTVMNVMETVAKREDAPNLSVRSVRKYFLINAQLNNIERFNDKTVKTLVNIQQEKRGKTKYLHVAYDAKNVFFKDLHLGITFDHKIPLDGSAVSE